MLRMAKNMEQQGGLAGVDPNTVAKLLETTDLGDLEPLPKETYIENNTIHAMVEKWKFGNYTRKAALLPT